MLFPILILQKPNGKLKSKAIKAIILQQLDLWTDGDFDSLVLGGHTIQSRLSFYVAKTGHVGTNYTPLLYSSYLCTGKVYFHSVTCIMMPITCLLRAENCNAIA